MEPDFAVAARSEVRPFHETFMGTKPKVKPTMKEFLEILGARFHALGCQQQFLILD